MLCHWWSQFLNRSRCTERNKLQFLSGWKSRAVPWIVLLKERRGARWSSKFSLGQEVTAVTYSTRRGENTQLWNPCSAQGTDIKSKLNRKFKKKKKRKVIFLELLADNDTQSCTAPALSVLIYWLHGIVYLTGDGKNFFPWVDNCKYNYIQSPLG